MSGWHTRSVSTIADPREARLAEQLRRHDALVIAFSGGVDSTLLLAAARDALGSAVTAATAVSPSLAQVELEQARQIAADLGVRHLEVATDEGERPEYRRNHPDRCFHCKSALFDSLEPLLAVGTTVAVGTITDDLGDHRPGQRAAAERGVVTPLADAGLSKTDVRELSRARGLPTWNKPAAACLASRVVYGLEVTPRRLSRIEQAEAWLRSRLPYGVDVRVRDHGDVARVEVSADAVGVVAAFGPELASVLTELGWTYATLDLGGFRSGSLNESLSS